MWCPCADCGEADAPELSNYINHQVIMLLPVRHLGRTVRHAPQGRTVTVGIIWTIIIGFLAGVIAKLLHPGPNEPSGFILTTILGIVGAFVATWLGQALGWYRPGEGAGLIGAVVGAVIVLVVWSMIARRSTRSI
jgi:uncharacterized membrane protein YeaQ/YmgE (transglycosylase-associated protein family)